MTKSVHRPGQSPSTDQNKVCPQTRTKSVHRPGQSLSTDHDKVCPQTRTKSVHRPGQSLSTDHDKVCPQTTTKSVHRPGQILSTDLDKVCPQTRTKSVHRPGQILSTDHDKVSPQTTTKSLHRPDRGQSLGLKIKSTVDSRSWTRVKPRPDDNSYESQGTSQNFNPIVSVDYPLTFHCIIHLIKKQEGFIIEIFLIFFLLLQNYIFCL